MIGSRGGLVGRSGGGDWDGSGLISGSWDWGVMDDRGMVDGGSMVDGSMVDWGTMVEWGGMVDGGMVSVVDSVSNSVDGWTMSMFDGGVTVLVSHGDSHKGRDGHKCL